jgi:hypothetical protein
MAPMGLCRRVQRVPLVAKIIHGRRSQFPVNKQIFSRLELSTQITSEEFCRSNVERVGGNNRTPGREFSGMRTLSSRSELSTRRKGSVSFVLRISEGRKVPSSFRESLCFN